MYRATQVLFATVVAVSALTAMPVGVHAAQGRNRVAPAPNAPNAGAAADDATVSPAEIQRLFDAYVVMQAQQALQLSDEQFPKFLARVKSLQEVRRRGQMQRGRMLQELRRLSQTPGQDDALRNQLKALNDLDARLGTEVRQALDGVDQTLDLRQQARFRLFEEQMERRKVDLLMRARQGNRLRNQAEAPSRATP
jgi:vacuolar-type H+-ATPase subunit I/STV1